MNDTTFTKICTKCKEEKPITEFYKDSRSKDMLQLRCKVCCKSIYRDTKDRMKDRRNRYYNENKSKLNLKSKSWYEKQKEITAASIKELHDANEEQYSDLIKDWWESNRKNKIILDKLWSDATKELYAHKKKIWKLEHPDIIAANNRNRRALKKSAKGTHTADDINNIKTLQKNKCVVCLKSLSKGYHVDHVVALINGGSNDKHNLQLLCPPCNTAKRAKDPIDFMQSRGFLL